MICTRLLSSVNEICEYFIPFGCLCEWYQSFVQQIAPIKPVLDHESHCIANLYGMWWYS